MATEFYLEPIEPQTDPNSIDEFYLEPIEDSPDTQNPVLQDVKSEFSNIKKGIERGVGGIGEVFKEKVLPQAKDLLENFQPGPLGTGLGVTPQPEPTTAIEAPAPSAIQSKPVAGKQDDEFKNINPEILSAVDKTAERNGVPSQILRALVKRESAFDPNAVGLLDERGLAQIRPETFKEVSPDGDIHDPAQTLDASAKYLARQHRLALGQGYSDDEAWKFAGAGYNGGPGNLRKAIRKAQKISGSETPSFEQVSKHLDKRAVEYAHEVSGALTKGDNFGLRVDGTKKGNGFLGILKRPDGNVSTELSVGVEIDGKETLIPTMVPGLTSKELDTLLNLKDGDGKSLPESIIKKAIDHAIKRMDQGKSPFLEEGEAPVGPATGEISIEVFDQGVIRADKTPTIKDNIIDTMKAPASGVMELTAVYGHLLDKIGNPIGKYVQNLGKRGTEGLHESFNPENLEAMNDPILVSNGPGTFDLEINPDISWRGIYFKTLKSLPGSAAGMGVGAVLNKTLLSFAQKLGFDVGAKTLATVGGASFGFGEGLLEGGFTSMEVSEMILNAPNETFKDSPLYKVYIGQGLSPDDARIQLADTLSSKAGWKSGTIAAALGAPMGMFFGKLLGGVLPGSKPGQVVTGAVGEGVQEAGQGFFSGKTKGEAKLEAGMPSNPTKEGIIEGAEGILPGAIMGGGTTAIFGGSNSDDGGGGEFFLEPFPSDGKPPEAAPKPPEKPPTAPPPAVVLERVQEAKPPEPESKPPPAPPTGKKSLQDEIKEAEADLQDAVDLGDTETADIIRGDIESKKAELESNGKPIQIRNQKLSEIYKRLGFKNGQYVPEGTPSGEIDEKAKSLLYKRMSSSAMSAKQRQETLKELDRFLNSENVKITQGKKPVTPQIVPVKPKEPPAPPAGVSAQAEKEAPEQSSKEFKKRFEFEGSKPVDEKGQAKVPFPGTEQSISVFEEAPATGKKSLQDEIKEAEADLQDAVDLGDTETADIIRGDIESKKAELESNGKPKEKPNRVLPLGERPPDRELVRDAKQVTEKPVTLYRGSGRRDRSTGYNSALAAHVGILGDEGKYYAFDKVTAETFGPDIETVDIAFKNPIIINNGEDLRAFMKNVGSRLPEVSDTAENIKRLTDNIGKYLRSQKIDAVVVDFESGFFDIDSHGGNVKRMRRTFGESQVFIPNQISENVKITQGEKPVTPQIVPVKPKEPPAPPAQQVDKKKVLALRKAADSLQKSIDADNNPGVANQNPTARRAGIAEGMRDRADRNADVQRQLRALADAEEAGTLPEVLKGIDSKPKVEALRGRSFPQGTVMTRDLEKALEEVKGKKGLKESREVLKQSLRLRQVGGGHQIAIRNAEEVTALRAVTRALKAADKTGLSTYQLGAFTEAAVETSRFFKTGINEMNFEEAKAALQALTKPADPANKAERELKQLENKLLGTKIPGFFPTPKPIVASLVDQAGIEDGMTVLEPSAGKGDIAEVIREEHPGAILKVLEVNSTLLDILDKKGFDTENEDFLEHQGSYDRIIMNPPFEKGQDIDHVRHAFELLAPGGRVVAIMSEGPFFRNDKKATEFRDFLDEEGGTSEKLEAGSFKGKESFRQTGVNGRVVVLDKAGVSVQAEIEQKQKEAPITKTPEFKKRFEGSKAVDEKGQPKVLFHGTVANIQEFDKAKIREVDHDIPVNGFWFSSDPSTTPAFKSASNVLPVFLDVKNPAPGRVWRRVAKEVASDDKLRKEARSADDETRLRLQDAGYDGIKTGGISKADVDLAKFEKEGQVDFQDARGFWRSIKKDQGGISLFDGKGARDQEFVTGYGDLEEFFELQGEETWLVFEPEQIISVFEEAPEQSSNIPVNRGHGSRVTGRDGKLKTVTQNLEITYKLVESDDVLASHNEQTFNVVEGYPKGLQERQYDQDKPSQLRVIDQANNFDADFIVTDDPTATNGPPIVLDDLGIVLGGNSRTMTVKRVYAEGRGKEYIDTLKQKAASFGLDPASISEFREPMLVRVVKNPPTDLTKLRALASDLNKTFTADLSVFEAAVSAGKRISEDTIKFIGQELDKIGDTATLRQLFEIKAPQILDRLVKDGALTTRELPKMFDQKRHLLTELGKDFLERALIGTVVDEPALLSNIPAGIRNKIAGILPSVTSINASGSTFNISQEIKDAAKAAIHAQAQGMTADQYFSQGSLFDTGEDLSPNAAAIFETLMDNKPNEIKKKFRTLAAAIAQEVEGQTSFLEARTPEEIFNSVFGGIKSSRDAFGIKKKPLPSNSKDNHSDNDGTRWEGMEQMEVEKLNALEVQVTLPTEASTKETVNKAIILDLVEKSFGVPVRNKVTRHMRDAAGWFENKGALIRLKAGRWGSIEILIHELGHHIDRSMKQSMGTRWKTLSLPKSIRKQAIEELKLLDYDQTKQRINEGLSEFLRHYMTTGRAQKLAPTYFKWFNESFLKRAVIDKTGRMALLPEGIFTSTPKGFVKLKEPFNKLHKAVQVWYAQGSENRMRAQIDFNDKLQNSDDSLRRKSYKFVMREFYDSNFLFEEVTEDIKKRTGKKIRPTKDPFKIATMYKGKVAGIAETMIRKAMIDPHGNVVGPSLTKAIKPAKIKSRRDFEDWLTYAVALKARNNTKRGFETGFDIADIEYVIGKHGSKRGWMEAAEAVTEWSSQLMDWYVWSGDLSPQLAKMFRDLNPIYMPFMRVFKESFNAAKGVGGFEQKGSAIKATKGSTRPLINPMRAFVESAAAVVSRSIKTKIASSLADLAEEEGIGGIITPIPLATHVKQHTASQLLERLSDVFNTPIGALPNEITGEADEINPDEIINLWYRDANYYGKDNVVAIWRDGELKLYEVHPELYEAMKETDSALMPMIKWIAPFARLQRLGATGLNYAFANWTNPVRDFVWAAVTSKNKGQTPLAPFRGLAKEFLAREGSITDKAMNVGLAQATMMGFDRAATTNMYDDIISGQLGMKGKVLHVAKHPIDTLRRMFQIFELAPRVVELESYKRILKENPGYSPDDAFMDAFLNAQDVTVNFTKSGRTGKQINEVGSFFNVGLQGPNKFFRAMKGTPVKTIWRSLIWVTLPALMLWDLAKDKEWYKNIPPEYKYLNMWYEDDQGRVLRIPGNFELFSLFAGIPMAGLDEEHMKDEGAMAGAVKGLIESINPLGNIIPSVIRPYIDNATNRNWLDRPIEPEWMRDEKTGLPIEERKFEFTPELSVKMSQGLRELGFKMSPIQTDAALRQLTGGIYSRGMGLMDVQVSQQDFLDPRTFLRFPSRPTRQMTDFYTEKTRLQQLKNADKLKFQGVNRLKSMETFQKYQIRPLQNRIRKLQKTKTLENIAEIDRTYGLQAKRYNKFLDPRGHGAEPFKKTLSLEIDKK